VHGPSRFSEPVFRTYVASDKDSLLPGPVAFDQQLQLQVYRSELQPYAEVLCGDSDLARTALRDAFAEAVRSLRPFTTPTGLRVCFKHILAAYCMGLRGRIDAQLCPDVN
jgi:hypothetical protein